MKFREFRTLAHHAIRGACALGIPYLQEQPTVGAIDG